MENTQNYSVTLHTYSKCVQKKQLMKMVRHKIKKNKNTNEIQHGNKMEKHIHEI